MGVGKDAAACLLFEVVLRILQLQAPLRWVLQQPSYRFPAVCGNMTEECSVASCSKAWHSELAVKDSE